ncbi:unnamed protein product [Citrullus colocynthis]|uniref:25S rRNA (uridine-N(3))-methyltransferase BMT5-like domain-containing protein n=1 Tax=Citrullus colocynthis TaxID=252529 RepID=A0ABP0XKD5_9ROSI
MEELSNDSQKKIKHYSSSHTILLVGEGDFSFSACLAVAFANASNILATSLDSKESLLRKYTRVSRNLEILELAGGRVVHEVDATTMSQHPLLYDKSFDRIVFNFPHAGFHFKEHDNVQIDGRQLFPGPPADSREKWLKYYSSYHEILLVGEGDFSFSLSLAMSFGSASNIVATSLDSYLDVVTKYKNARLNLRILKGFGASVLHGVDATKMKLHIDLHMRKFDRIIFNFPHAGFFWREDNLLMIRMHKSLVHEFFENASQMLRVDGEIHVNHKTKPPFSDWNVGQLAQQNSLELIGCADFNILDYPGYNNKRGQGKRCDRPFVLGECSTYKFSINHSAKTTPRFLLHMNNNALDVQRNLPFPEIPISNHCCHHPYPTPFESGYSHRNISMQNHPTRFELDYSCVTHSVNAHSRFMTGMLERMSNDDVYWSSNLRSNYGEKIQRSEARRTMPRLFPHW